MRRDGPLLRPAPETLLQRLDETSGKKRHDYITVVSDQETGLVLHVSPGKDAESLGNYYQSLSTQAVNRLESVAMDMSPAYISATKEYLPHCETAICFDRFHVAAAFGKALNKEWPGSSDGDPPGHAISVTRPW